MMVMMMMMMVVVSVSAATVMVFPLVPSGVLVIVDISYFVTLSIRLVARGVDWQDWDGRDRKQWIEKVGALASLGLLAREA